MGQKIHPFGFRVGITQRHRSRWYASKRDYARLLKEDQEIRYFIKKHYNFSQIPRIEIERTRETLTIYIHTAKPGFLIGKKGAKLNQLEQSLKQLSEQRIHVKIVEVQRPDLDAQIVAEAVCEQLKRRSAFRRVIKKTIEQVVQAGALGVRIRLAGRLGGSEMARREQNHWGSIPLQTLNADVDYGFAMARTTAGAVGCKVWIYRGKFSETEQLRQLGGTRRGRRRHGPANA